jgi:hypothetical protein
MQVAKIPSVPLSPTSRPNKNIQDEVQVPSEATEVNNIVAYDTADLSIPAEQVSLKQASTIADDFSDLDASNLQQLNADFLVPTNVLEEIPSYFYSSSPSAQVDPPSHASPEAILQKDFVMIDLTKENSPIKIKESTHHQKTPSASYDISNLTTSPAYLQRPSGHASSKQPSDIQNRPRYSVTFASKENTAAPSLPKLPKHTNFIAMPPSVTSVKKVCK